VDFWSRKLQKNIKKFILFKNYLLNKRWTPYSFVLLYNSFKPATYDSMPLISTVSAVFAKSSVVWSTLFYILTNKTVKEKLFQSKKPKHSAARRSTRFSKSEMRVNKSTRMFSIKTLGNSNPSQYSPNKRESKSSAIINVQEIYEML